MSLRIFNFIFIFAVFVLFSCGKSEVELQLETADSLIEDYPDSAYTILKDISQNDLKNDRERAKYGLLYTYARHKNHLPIENDSLISFSMNYYSRHGNKFDRMRTAMQYGKVKYDSGNYQDAIIAAMEAEELAQELKDDYWLAKSVELKGDILSKTVHFDEAYLAYKTASNYYGKANRWDNQLFSLCDAAGEIGNNGNYKYAIELLDSIRQLKNEGEYKDVIINYSNELLLHYLLYTKDFERANQIAQDIFQRKEISQLVPYDLCDLAHLYYARGDTEKSYFFIELAKQRLSNYSDSILIWEVLELINRTDNNYKSATLYKDSLLNMMIRNTRKTLKESPIVSQREYFDLKAQKEKKNKEDIIVWTILTGIILMAVITATIIFYRMKIRLKESEISSLINESHYQSGELKGLNDKIRELTDEIEHHKREMTEVPAEILNELREKNRELFRNQWSGYNLLCNEYGDIEKDESKYNIVVKNIARQIDRLKTTKKFKEIEASVDENMNNLASRFREECHYLKNDDIRFAILLFAGFSSRAICLILEIGHKNFYSRRERLISKINIPSVKDREEFIKYLY